MNKGNTDRTDDTNLSNPHVRVAIRESKNNWKAKGMVQVCSARK